MMIHEPTRSVLLQVPDPFMIRDLIPKSKTLIHPDFNVAFKHTVESAQIACNLGYDVPSPILTYYDWPMYQGIHPPMDHQREMAAFTVRHPRLFNLSEMGCVDAATEYLSPTGWRRIDQYTGGPVGQYWPERGVVELVEPTKYVKLPCPTMIRFKTTRGVDQLLSPEHRVLLANGAVVSAQHIADSYGSQSVECRSYRFRTTFSVHGAPGLPLSTAQIRLHVAASADGWYRSPTNVVVRIKKTRKIERLRQLLAAAQVPYTEREGSPAGFCIFSFRPVAPKGFTSDWWLASQAQLEAVAAEAPHWDGSHRKAGGVAVFGTRQDVDFIQYALSASGRRTTLMMDARNPNHWAAHSAAGDPTIGLYGRNGDSIAKNVTYEPSPDGFKYCFMVPSTFLLLRRNGCIFATGNTGKTAGTLWALDAMMNAGVIRRCAILSPLSTLKRVWQQDIFDVLMHRVSVVVHGGREARAKALSANVDFYIINHDGVAIPQIIAELRKRSDIDCIVVDEGSIFRNADTNKWKGLRAALRADTRIIWLTGTPCPNNPTDAWAQAKIICPERVPQYFGAFKRLTMTQVSPFKWAPKPGSHEIAFNAMQPAIRFKKEDCIDLPPVVKLDRQAALTPEQRKEFQSMKEDMIAEAKSRMITAVNAADKIGKLRQILCGCVKHPESGDYLVLPHGPRLKVLKESIEQARAKVIVVVPFKGIIGTLAKELGQDYTVGVLNGDVSIRARNEIIENFKYTAEPHILLCHPKVMSHGLNLTEADTLIFYAPIYSNDEYQQVTERFNRKGQKLKMTIVRIGAHPIEWQIYKVIDDRKMSQDTILDLYGMITE